MCSHPAKARLILRHDVIRVGEESKYEKYNATNLVGDLQENVPFKYCVDSTCSPPPLSRAWEIKVV